MTGAMFTQLLQSMGLLSIFLLLGFLIRAKVKIFQKTFIPASVIGGFLLLILGPIGFGLLPIPEDWIKIWSLIPGILIVPVVTATPLGLKLGGKDTSLKPALPLLFIMFTIYYLQNVIGFGTNVLFSSMGNKLYDTFGWELVIGYTGGHGTAGILGNMLSELNLPYWQTAQGVGVTMATFGIVGGIVFGMILINWAARAGETAILDKPSDIPESLKIGYVKNISEQKSNGDFKKNGFKVEDNLANIPTAFKATYGKGDKTIAFLGEFDALSGLSQVAGITEEKELVKGACGHGCGHHMLGTASMGQLYN